MMRFPCAVLFVAAALPPRTAAAQEAAKTADDLARVHVGVALTPEARRQLGGASETVVRAFEAALARVDMGAFAPGSPSRFLLAVDVQALSEDVTPTAPPLVALRARVSARFGDRVSGRAFAEFSREVAVTGRTRELAYRTMGNRLRLEAQDWRDAAREANGRIVAFFESSCEAILLEAQALISQQRYEDGLVALTSIPREARTCHSRSQIAVGDAFRAMQTGACLRTFGRAQARWAADRSSAAALAVADSLGNIPPGSPCYPEAEALLGEVTAVLARGDSVAAEREREEFAQRKREYDDALTAARARAQSDENLRTAAQQQEYAIRMAGIEMAGRIAVSGALKRAASSSSDIPTHEFRP